MVTRGVALNDLVGRRFAVGEVEAVGNRLCDPCSHLEKVTKPGVLKGLVDRGGLRADVVRGGAIRVGDEVRELATARSEVRRPVARGDRWRGSMFKRTALPGCALVLLWVAPPRRATHVQCGDVIVAGHDARQRPVDCPGRRS